MIVTLIFSATSSIAKKRISSNSKEQSFVCDMANFLYKAPDSLGGKKVEKKSNQYSQAAVKFYPKDTKATLKSTLREGAYKENQLNVKRINSMQSSVSVKCGKSLFDFVCNNSQRPGSFYICYRY